MKNKISVIIPMYNVEEYIEDCIGSIVNQTTEEHIEIILVNDCSTDGTLEKAKKVQKENKKENRHIKIIELEENKRQGYARNFARKQATGEYIYFLDGDDFVDQQAFEIMLSKEEEDTEIIMSDWCYYYEDEGKVFINNNKFMNKDRLEGEECEDLIASTPYFTVNKLYKKEFLDKNNIYYGEGYIYEDVEFFVAVAVNANYIKIVQNPFYNVRINQNSTTKTNTDSMIHLDSFIKATEETYKIFRPRKKYTQYHLNKYIIRKSLDYAELRAPSGKKKYMVEKITEVLNKNGKNYLVPKDVVPLFYYLFRRKYVQNANHKKIIETYKIYKAGKLNKKKERLEKTKKMIKKNPIGKKMYKKRLEKARTQQLEKYKNQKIKPGKVFMFGFDYKYEGNSRRLFDKLYQDGYDVIYVTDDQRVPEMHRVAPRTMEFFKELYRSEIILMETWTPLDFEKREGQTWIQLWHGTPYKKLLFDSHEKDIMIYNPNHKKNKYKDIKRWDMILADSEIAKEKFITAFAMPEEKIKVMRYPRVQWIKDNQNNEEMKMKIKRKLGIADFDKPVLTYMPTWRDYNHKKNVNQTDLKYTLDMEKLKEGLNEEYIIINKNHPLAKTAKKTNGVIEEFGGISSEEIMLITDVMISDYSSAIFDIIGDKKVYNIEKDYEKYEDTRGVYGDIREILKTITANNEEELIQLIKSGKEINKEMIEKITSKKQKNGYVGMKQFINKKQKETLFEKPIKKNKIFMFGFDYKNEGNSKYLYEYLKNKDYDVKIATRDEKVDGGVMPRATDFYKEMYTAEVIIFESWIPLDLEKREGQIWIQLWHGTPYKKLLMDSDEKDIMALNPNHQKNKLQDIERWDYLLADSEIAKEKFITSMKIASEKIKLNKYPRVQWLDDNKDNETKKEDIMRRINNGKKIDKKIVLYAPTWRDYNFKKEHTEMNFDYLADLKKLKATLGNDYIIINKDHPLSDSMKNEIDGVINCRDEIDTQEAILISDVVVTDYSSIVFDVMGRKEFYFIEKDYDKYSDSRGVYDDMRKTFKQLIATNEEDLAKKIKTGLKIEEKDAEKMSSMNLANAYEEFEKLIAINYKKTKQ